MVQLPVCGRQVELRRIQGWDDLLLIEEPRESAEVVFALIGRLARSDGEPLDAGSLTVTDVEVLLLHIQRITVGDVIRTDVRCPSESCRARVDVDFRINDYLAHHLSHRPAGVTPAEEPGW